MVGAKKIFWRGEKMKRVVRQLVCLVVVCVMAIANFASAENIRGINIDFVNIGNAGNTGDTRTGTDEYGNPIANPYSCGAVSYNYRIGKYEVSNAQWDTFTAAAGVPIGNNGSYWTAAAQPANAIRWYEAAQFCNYLTSGNKYSGAYQFDQSGTFLGIDRVSSISTYGTTYVIPTQDEWYKAAYFKPDGSGYSCYASGTDAAPIAGVDTNYDSVFNAPWDITNGTQEQNGTFNMMGNITEWNETLYSGSFRIMRGGSCYNRDYFLSSSLSDFHAAYNAEITRGFRVASIPEPASLLLLSLGATMLRRRK
jgi:formylglycine-generating enzyme